MAQFFLCLFAARHQFLQPGQRDAGFEFRLIGLRQHRRDEQANRDEAMAGIHDHSVTLVLADVPLEWMQAIIDLTFEEYRPNRSIRRNLRTPLTKT